MSQERARAAIEALKLLASLGDEMYDELQRKVRWIKIDEGTLLFNNEYPLESGEAVEMAMLLLGCARRLGKI